MAERSKGFGWFLGLSRRARRSAQRGDAELQAEGAPRAEPRRVDLSSLRAALGPGRPLDAQERRRAEAELGPLGPVRVHDGPEAHAVARDLGAQGFAFGRDVGVARGDLGTAEGSRALVHELAHVKQAGDASLPQRLPVEPAGAPAERAAAAAERGPAGGALAPQGAALRLKRVEIFDLSWNVDHADVTGSTAADAVEGIVTELTGKAGKAAETEAAGLQALAGGKDELLLRALDFLRDNRDLLPAVDVGDLLRRGAEFCAGRLDDASQLADDFYRALLVAVLYTAEAGSLSIEHKSGSKHAVPGVSAKDKAFGATASPTSLQRPARDLTSPVKGGFDQPLSLTIGFATGARFPGAGVAQKLVDGAGKRVDPLLKDALLAVCEDKYVYHAVKTFLGEGGKFVAWASGGKYEATSPPVINVGTGEGPLDTRSSLIHELMHYVFDKSDSLVAEIEADAEHPAIAAIETRFVLIDLIRSGEPPLHDKVENAFGRFLKGKDFFPRMEQAIADDDQEALKDIVTGTGFLPAVVGSGLLGEASGLAFSAKGEDYSYTPDQFRDLAFVWAQNATIVKRAMTEAVRVAETLGVPLKDAFGTKEWRAAMEAFLRSFVLELQKDPGRGAPDVERGL
jgi:hypothetical protein